MHPSPPLPTAALAHASPRDESGRGRPPTTLCDAWPGARSFRLDGWFERNGFGPLGAAALVFAVAWVAFQAVGGIVAAVWMGVALAAESPGEPFDPAALADPGALLARFPGALLVSNTIGQVVGLGLVAWLAVRWSTRRGKAPFLRLRRPDGRGLGLAVAGWAVLLPLLFWLGEVNAGLPLPRWLVEFEAMQADVLAPLLEGGSVGLGWLLLALAVTPALFEELLFRGYLQRQVERRWGAAASVVLVGVLFGAFHLRFSQVLPLATLGVYLGYAVWATGSLWTGSLVHVLHNGSVILGLEALRRFAGLDAGALESASVPLWLAAVSAALAVSVVGALGRRRSPPESARIVPDPA